MASEHQGPKSLAQRASVTTAEILMAAAAFFAGLLVLTIPGVQGAIFWLEQAVFGRPELSPDKVRQIQSMVLTPLATLFAAGFYRWLGRNVDMAAMPAMPMPIRPIPAGFFATIGWVVAHLLLAVLGSFALALLMQALGAPVVEQTLVLEITRDGDLRRPELAILCFSALALAPLAEELFFRQQLFGRIRRNSGPIAAYLASAILFAAFHNNLQGLVVYVWLGLVFASTYARTGRISAAIVVHFANNAFTLTALVS
ncbi:MAG: CPBP family intramembrane metalloprotease [Nannocystis sp.]|nr:CPBP family intramembrane glutamic endopeptidase [Nannocystis sp.]MBA3550187.1 CPBP family intramembrane metalloprotease [Nannocystis sp.]